MTFNSTNDITRPSHRDEVDEFEDEFDKLLEQSSLGAPNARAIQALTSEDIVETIQDRADAQAPEHVGEDGGSDVDDYLLDLVRCAVLPIEHGSASRRLLPRQTAWDTPMKGIFIRSGFGSGKTVSWAVLARLAEANVFGYVRRDVARSILDIAFRSTCSSRPVLVMLVTSAAARSGIVDEFTDHLRQQTLVLRAETERPYLEQNATSGISCLNRSILVTPAPLRTTITSCLPMNRIGDHPGGDTVRWSLANWIAGKTRRFAVLSARWRNRDAGGTHSTEHRDMLDELVEVIEQFAARWFATGPVSTSQHLRQQRSSLDSISVVTGALLGLLHEGPQNSRRLITSTRRRLALPDVTRVGVRNELCVLHETGLVHRPDRLTPSWLQARYQLTDSGQRTFQQWLLAAPDFGRGQVVLRLLFTIAFNPDQREKLLALSTNLELDNDQAEALSVWMTENSSRYTASHATGRDILMNLINRDSNEH